jgi:hypothetical protein
MLLQRLKARVPENGPLSGHRLFISALMIAAKAIYDDTYSNRSWGIVTRGMFSLKDVNTMEREMCDYLKWEFTFTSAILSNFEMLVMRDFSQDRTCYPTYPLSVVSKRISGQSPTGTQPILSLSMAATANSLGGHGEFLPTSPASSTHSPYPQQQTQTDAPTRPSLSYSSLESGIDTPSPSHSNTTSPTPSEPPRTPTIDFQRDPAYVAIGLDESIQTQSFSSLPLFTVVEELPELHPLRGRMYSFALASIF